MKKTARSLHIFLSSAAALFIALSPLIHGLHLLSSSHHHNCCNVCIDNSSAHNCSKSHTCNGYGAGIYSSSDEDRSEGHNPDTCPLCRQFTQLLKNQIILQGHTAIPLQDSLSEKHVYLAGCFSNISYSNIIPRAPPAC